ncbi:MAG TPA: thioredoxin domain-containing protein [Rhizobiales bacterium]|nr:thioredoxin domain-containing protein [Hyphomicrobiales bacterium]
MPLPAANILSSETSPYLLQHRDNPVHWRPWSPDAIAEARETGRPILVSVGYAACHWCHVMAHESFEDADVAAVMNRLFVNIKIDREERPDLDQIFMAALTATGEQGGWPLTMFLTPEGKPFCGGTYFPRHASYGRPGFIEILEAVHHAWTTKHAELSESASLLTRHVESRLAVSATPRSFDPRAFDDYAERISRMIDMDKGGIRGAPKFPNAPLMNVLRLSWLNARNPVHRDAALHSLAEMLKGGIYDHVGGGVSRYSTDSDWIVPHFEKMLYDNAQLIDLAGWAHSETGENLFRFRIEETIDWLLREMRTADGAFASSLDADSEGEEGRFYTWDRSEIESILADDAGEFLSLYRLNAPAGWHGSPILSLEPHRPADRRAFSEPFRRYRSSLLAARDRRTRPARDDKVLTDWNGLAISAIARAARQFSRSDWLDAAFTAYRFVYESTDFEGRLAHSTNAGRRLFPALSSDYAAMIAASLSLLQATGEQTYLLHARRLADQLDLWHGDGAGAHYLTASDHPDVPMRIRGDVDDAVPSATSQIILALAQLAAYSGADADAVRAQRAADAAFGRIADQPYGQAGILAALAVLADSSKLITVDRPGDSTFARIACTIPDPRRVDIAFATDTAEPATRLPGGIVPNLTLPGAWLCTAYTCRPFIADHGELERALRRGTA